MTEHACTQGCSALQAPGQNEEDEEGGVSRWEFPESIGKRYGHCGQRLCPGPGGFRGKPPEHPFCHVCLSSNVYLLIRCEQLGQEPSV